MCFIEYRLIATIELYICWPKIDFGLYLPSEEFIDETNNKFIVSELIPNKKVQQKHKQMNRLPDIYKA